MADHVVVFSPDAIRGQILQKTLDFGGLEGAVHPVAQDAIREFLLTSCPVLIFDAKDNPDAALRVLAGHLPPALLPKRVIVLIGRDGEAGAAKLKRPGIVTVPEPLAPEYIFTLVQEFPAVQTTFSLKKLRIKAGRSVRRSLPFVLKTLLLAAVLALAAGAGFVFWSLSDLPDIARLGEYAPFETSKLYSGDNTLLAELFVEKRTFLPPGRIPELVKNAFIAVEDARYYEHSGVDLIRIIGAAIKDIRKSDLMEGASTITQQLVKRLYLTPEKTIVRKIREIALAIKIEKRYTKAEILGLYLNQAFFGANAYGIEAAARVYFEKPASGLDAAEAALLAAVIKAPTALSPFRNPEGAKERRDFVLQQMLQKNFIRREDYDRALVRALPSRLPPPRHKAPYFVDYCRSLLDGRYGDRYLTAGMEIYTTLDDRLQRIAEDAVDRGILALSGRGLTGAQAALVAVEIGTGRIKAMVGGTDFSESQFNRATQAMRQPGSAFKPIVYLTALMKGYHPEGTIVDEETTYSVGGRPWTPHNFDGWYAGPVTLNDALTYSLNAATVYLAKDVGMADIIATARRLGIRSKIHPYLSSALGASELTPLELACAYASLARGFKVEPIALARIVDRRQFSAAELSGPLERLIPKDTVDALNLMLRRVVVEGTGKPAAVLNRPVFGKTGSTNDFTDGWFVGFDDQLVTAVWVGRDNHAPLGDGETGSKTALPIWIEFMKRI